MTVRRLTPDDALLWKEVRLRMLAADPSNFGANYDEWVGRPLSDWQDSLRHLAIVASMDGERAVGAMGLWPETEPTTRHRARLIAVWLDPEWRGGGRAAAMLDGIVAIARERGIVQIELNVHDQNDRARRFYERQGFVRFGLLPRAVLHEGEFTDDLLMVRMLDA